MAVGDVYLGIFNCSSNNRAWSFSSHFEEVNPITTDGDGQIVATALAAHFNAEIVNVLSDDSYFESVTAYKIGQPFGTPGLSLRDVSAGLRTGRTMPNDNALVISLRQAAQSARKNGRVFIAGQIAENQSQNVWDTNYLNTRAKDLADRFLLQIDAVSPDTGSWRTVVLSKSVTPPANTWGTPLDVTSAVAIDRVFTQRRRQQRVKGWTNV